MAWGHLMLRSPCQLPVARLRGSVTMNAIACFSTAFFVTSAVLSAQTRGPSQSTIQPALVPEATDSELIEGADGSFRGEGRGHRASFTGLGAKIGVAHPDDSDSDVSATFRLDDHGRAGHTALVTACEPVRGGADYLQYDHGLVVERYRVDAGGFEQSFVLRERPAGHGDYVIGVAVTGVGLELPKLAAAHQSVAVRHQGCETIRYGEAVVFERGGQPVPIATRCDGAGRIELVVPGDFLDRASYPVVVDPAVGPVFLPAGGYFSDQSPDASHDVDSNRYMVVWERTFSGSNVEIRGRIFDDTGLAVSPIVSITNSGLCRNPAVAWIPQQDAYVVVWEQDDRIRQQLFDNVTAAPISNGTWASSPPAGSRDRRPDVCRIYSSSAVVVWDRTAAGQNSPSRVMSRYRRWVTGVPYTGPVLVLEYVSSFDGYVRAPRLPQTGTSEPHYPGSWAHVDVAWERFYNFPSPGDADVRHAVLEHKTYLGTFEVRTGPESVDGADDIGVDEVTPSLAWANGRSLIAWDDDRDIYAAEYSVYGSLLTNAFPIRATAALQTMPAVGGGGCNFTIAYAEADPATPFSKNILAARVVSSSVAIDDRAVDVLNGPNQGGLRVASSVSTQLLVWWGETGIGAGSRDVRARFFEPVQPNVFPYGDACPGPGQSLPQIGTANGQPIPGNDTFRFTISNGPPNSIAILMVSDILTTTPVPGAPGCELYLGLPLISTTPGVVFGNGMGSVFMPIPSCVPHGTTLAFQWAVYTPGWNALEFVFSDDLDITWAH